MRHLPPSASWGQLTLTVPLPADTGQLTSSRRHQASASLCPLGRAQH